MIGKWIFIFGLVLAALGLAFWLAESLGFPPGRLPGDVQVHGKGWSLYFPLATCILLSIVLTVLLNVLFRFFRR